ncbi:GGDEF domain-containing protein [Alkalicoccus luteus]|uniref:GGDEF domain-containing protein n=1 Tax=Alkalicoccus luteus TaxID=1237094 RepID=UPI0040345F93
MNKHVIADAEQLFIDHMPLQVLLLRDVTEETKAKTMIEHLAYHDPLTDSWKSVLFMRRLKRRLKHGEKGPCLDGFKLVNDLHGHQTGDDFLIYTADILQHAAGPDSMTARVGGDEFYVIKKLKREDSVEAAAEQMMNVIRSPRFKLTETTYLPVKASVGISVFPDQSIKLDYLIHLADTARYKMKQNGKQNYAIARLTAD